MWAQLSMFLVLCVLPWNVAAAVKPYMDFGQPKQCRRLEWSCRQTGQCISVEAVCDGQRDCRDGSDETAAECSGPDLVCGPHVFRCSYGACVDRNLICNGQRDCADGSDEDPFLCASNASSNYQDDCQPPSHFKCDNGQCVGHLDICDGKYDCADKSDESRQFCSTFTCTALAFRCSYGACVDSKFRCDGINHCADGSDEDIFHCNTAPPRMPNPMYPFMPDQARPTFQPLTGPRPNYPYITDQGRKPGVAPGPRRPPPRGTTTTTERTSARSCSLPDLPRNGLWLLEATQCDSGFDCEVGQGVRSLPAGTKLVYSCNQGYSLNGSANVYCGINGRWSHRPTCEEIRCPAVSSPARYAKCAYASNSVPCDQPVPPGTTATLSCYNSYTQDTTDLSSKNDIKCGEDGRWDYTPINCVPVCGVPSGGVGQPLIVHGSFANATEFPWHGTLYEDKQSSKQFICGATIIKNNLLITAAHCVYDEGLKRVDTSKKYLVAVGNFFRDYDFDGDANKVTAKVLRTFVACLYSGSKGNYANDIAILQIDRTIEFSAAVMPVCLDTNGDYDKAALEIGNEGLVPGFGRTSTGDTSFILQKLNVPIISLNICKSIADSEKYVTRDKICAGYTNGSAICDGDSGGGLVIRTDNRMYLRGIVSVGVGISKSGAVRTCDSFSYTLYTQVSNWMAGITDVIHRVATNKIDEKVCIP